MKSPLLIGTDIVKLEKAYMDVLLNEEVIAFNQDKLGKQGKRISKDGSKEVWAV